MGRTIAPRNPLAAKLEGDWDRELFRGPKALAVRLGWVSFHVLRSRGSKAGFPDRTLYRERVIFAELKREKETATPVSDSQKEWLSGLAKAGAEVYLWRPSDLEEIGKILSGRWTLEPAETIGPSTNLPATSFPPKLYRKDYGSWTPGSLWIPDVGRFDESPAEGLR